MTRSRTGPVFARMRSGCGLLWLVAALFMVRALLPTGYMPDAAALRQGVIAVTLCSADGTLRHVALAVSSPAVPDDAPAMQDAALCSFGLTGSWGPAPTHVASVPMAPFSHWQVLRPERRAAPNRVAAGPPLGSRAPPVIA